MIVLTMQDYLTMPATFMDALRLFKKAKADHAREAEAEAQKKIEAQRRRPGF
jgi:hypothetical protein